MSEIRLFTERLLQLVWQTCRFELQGLRTTDGRQLMIIHPGRPNPNQGPDFLGAKIVLNGEELVGAIELHIDANDWYLHKHEQSDFYNQVILHVACKNSNNRPIFRPDGTVIPEFIITPFIDQHLIRNYAVLQEKESSPLACESLIESVRAEVSGAWFIKQGQNRLRNKAEYLAQQITDWEESAWQAVAGAFGGPLNKEAFIRLAQAVPYRILRKYRDRPAFAEAGLFGAANFLNDNNANDGYIKALQPHWQQLQALHNLPKLSDTLFSFAKLRPAAFPTVRLALLAALATQPLRLIEFITNLNHWQALELQASEYWTTHYRFSVESKPTPKTLSTDLKTSTLINAFIPLALAYALRTQKNENFNFELISEQKPEKNNITRIFTNKNVILPNALATQGAIQVYKEFCVPRRCLECAIGQALLILPSTHKNP